MDVLARLIAVFALALAACTSVKGTGQEFEVSTFGSGKVEVTAHPNGTTTVVAQSNGTNVLGIFTGLFKVVGGIFGSAPPPEVTVNVAPSEKQP